MTPRTISELSKQIYPRERFAMPYNDGKLGGAVKEFDSSAGTIKFHPDVFLRPGRRNGVLSPPAAATTATLAAPVIGAIAPAAGNSFFAGSVPGYTYYATSINRFGESAPSAGVASGAVTAGQICPINITGGGAAATGYRLYRAAGAGLVGASQLIREVPAQALTGSYIDDNFLLPGHGRGYMIQGNVNNLSFRMLAPMLKIPMATIAASIRWIQVLYGTPIVYSPLKNVCFLNVPDTLTVAQP